MSLNDRDGLLEISSQFGQTYQSGQQALTQLRQRLAAARESNDAAEVRRILEEAAPLLDQFGSAARAVQEVNTRGGLNDYATIENWLNLLYADRRASQATCDAGQSSTETLRLEGVMLGFNLTGVNKHDATYRTGTAVKLMLDHEARAMASDPRWGGARVLGIWGTNMVVSDIPANRTAEFHAELRNRLLEFFRTNQPLPAEVVRAMGVQRLSTNDLAGRDWLVSNPRNVGLTAGHASSQISLTDVQPIQADLRVIRILQSMAVAEAEAKRLGRETFIGEVPADSPSHARAARPLLRSGRVIPEGTNLEDIPALPPSQRGQTPEGVTEEDIRAGLLPRPAHDAGHSIQHQRRLATLVSEAAAAGDVEGAHQLIDQALQYMDNPEPRQPEVSVEAHLEQERDLGQQHIRFEGVLRPEVFSQLLSEMARGRRVFVQQTEVRDMFGHSVDHAPDARDSLLRTNIDITIAGHEYRGVEVTMAQMGDEMFTATIEPEGARWTDADLARISDYVATNTERIFESVTHHNVHKVPPMPGGFYEGRAYAIESRTVDGRTERVVHIDGDSLSDTARADLVSVIQEAHGIQVDATSIRPVDNIANVAQVERWNGYIRVTESGRILYVTRPQGTPPPEGFVPAHSPYAVTITPMVEVPPGSPPEVYQLAMDRTGELANAMKALGIDRPGTDLPAPRSPRPSPDGTGLVYDPRAPRAATADPLPNRVQLGWIERLQATRGGRLQMNAGMFGLASLITQGTTQLATGHSQLASLQFYMSLAPDYAFMAGGTAAGETLARTGITAMDGELFQRVEGRLLFNRAAFAAEYTGLRSMSVHGGGMLGAIVMMQLAHGGLSGEQTGRTMVGMVGSGLAARGLAYGSLYALEYTGVLSASGRVAAMRSWQTAVVVLAIEAVGLAVNEIFWSNRDRNAAEQDLRSRAGDSMRRLDHLIARNTLTNPDGSVNESAVTEYRNAVRDVHNAYTELMVFEFAQQTEEGRAFASAQSAVHHSEQAMSTFLGEYPQIRDEIRAHPDQENQILERYQRQFHDFFANNPFDTRSGYDDSLAHNRLRRLIDDRTTARADLQRAQSPFQEMVRRRLEGAAPHRLIDGTPETVHLHLSASAFSAGLPNNPVEVYQQLQTYIQSRITYADVVQVQGGDPNAIRDHYPEDLPRPPQTVTTLDWSLVQPQQTWDPFRDLLLTGSAAPRFPAPFLQPFSGDGNQIFVLPNATDTPSLLSQFAIGGNTAATTPIYEFDDQGRLRPVRTQPQPVDGGLLVFADGTNGTSVRPPVTIDVSGSPRAPMARLGSYTLPTSLFAGNSPRIVVTR